MSEPKTTPRTAQAASAALPPQLITEEVLLEKYAKGDERSADDVRRRVARALAQAEAPEQRAHWEARFLDAQQRGFVPAGRISSAAGTELSATLINCFVQPVGDSIASVEDGHPGIYTALTEAAETMRRGGGVGYDFSRIRPRGAWVGSTQSQRLRAGELHARVRPLLRDGRESPAAGAARRWACCAATIRTSRNSSTPRTTATCANFNISVGVTDAFMQAVRADGDVELVHRAEPGAAQKADGAYQRADGLWVYRKLPARALWEQIMRSTYDHAEPGVLFLDRINADNNLGVLRDDCEHQPLRRAAAARLRLLLPRLDRPDALRARSVRRRGAAFDYAALRRRGQVAVRMLDNVLDVTVWPLPQQHAEARSKRRVGLGFTGLGDALVMLGLRYDTKEAREMATAISETMRDAAYDASVELARERGAFPLFNADLYLSRRQLRVAPAAGAEGPHPRARHPQLAPAVDRAHRHHQPGLCRQREQRHRAGVLAGATSARSARATARFKEYAVEDHAWRLYRHLKGADAPLTPAFVTALEMSAQAHAEMVAAVAPLDRHRDLQDRQRAGRLSRSPTSSTCTCRPGRRA